ncbi:hypothetical protein CDD81_6267 [Ophiocordyceps australis]|uniref:Actin-related protein RO7 n=1 Tax=Ophiocordyceps australis TaxID=1399860 RepID=A0A2C5Y5Z5_9HYPO|nr:hypothetical protein CDD81_6267 [Ophiocordyceps australis]
MPSGEGPALAHRSVASTKSASTDLVPSPSSPRSVATYTSPSALRAEEDYVLVELGSRFVRVGFGGDALPKVKLSYGPAQNVRAGDFDFSRVADGWAQDHELWPRDFRNLDLGLLRDKVERLLKDAFTGHLLIDSRPRRISLVLDSMLPIPVVSAVLDTLFNKFQAPMVSLMPSPTMSVVAAGVRSGLVVDMGWNETVVTSVYEYRQVKTTRSIRAGRFLVEALYKLLHKLLRADKDEQHQHHVLSFDECEDVLCRLMWCRPSSSRSCQRPSAPLDTVEERDESAAESVHASDVAEVQLCTTTPPSTLRVPLGKLADICDDSFFDLSAAPCTFDDDELPLHLLIYHHLLRLPLDVRGICMSRIMFVGGCCNILGIKERVVDELTTIVDKRGWVATFGKGVDQLQNNEKLRTRAMQRFSNSSTASLESSAEDRDSASVVTEASEDAVEAKLARNRPPQQQLQGKIRVLRSLGPWSGASLICHLKVPAMATVEREAWLQQGANGASRPGEVDVKTKQRQSMGPIRSSGSHNASWTLGLWGALA